MVLPEIGKELLTLGGTNMTRKKNNSEIRLHREEIMGVIDNTFHKINIKIKNVESGFGLEDIHSFRTEIKKLKAFLRLLNVKFPKKLNKIYKILGHIRILQLQSENIGKLVGEAGTKMPFTYSTIHTESDRYNIQAQLQIKEYHRSKKNKAAIKTIAPDKITQKEIRKFIHTELHTLGGLLQLKEIDDESMHGIRKILKDIQYDESYIKNDLSAELISRLFLDEQIHVLTALLGDFHDICVSIKQLPQNLTDYSASEDEKKLLLEIKNRWLEDKNLLGKKTDQELEALKQYFLLRQ